MRRSAGSDADTDAAAQRCDTWCVILPPALSPARKQLERSTGTWAAGRELALASR